MSKRWLFFRRSRQEIVRTTPASHESEVAAPEQLAPEMAAPAEAPIEGNDAPVAPADNRSAVIPESVSEADSASDSAVTNAANSASDQTPSARLMDGPPLSYIDTQTAADWLAALADISAVASYKALSYDLLDLKPGQALADVGCGIGDDARALIGRVSPGGEVIGFDANETMIERANAADTIPGLRFAVADAANLPLADGSCDAVRADRMLQHLEDPLLVLREMRRILKPGGRLVVVEPDWKTMAIYPGSGAGGDDDHVTQVIFDWQVAHIRRPLIGRRLRALLVEAGFAHIAVNPVAYSSARFMEADLVLELTQVAESAAREWPDRLSLEDVREWRTAAQSADAAGHFFTSVPLYFGYARVE